MLLKERIRAIKQSGIHNIRIDSEETVIKRFLMQRKMLKPRHSRDIKLLISIIKSFALLNLWWRKRNGKSIIANSDDINEAFLLWEKVSVSQELGVPPYVFDLYQDVIVPAWENKNRKQRDRSGNVARKLGITRQEILDKHFRIYGRMMNSVTLRQNILPMLETAGLIIHEQDPNNKRQELIFPVILLDIKSEERNSETNGGVDSQTNDKEEPSTKDNALPQEVENESK